MDSASEPSERATGTGAGVLAALVGAALLGAMFAGDGSGVGGTLPVGGAALVLLVGASSSPSRSGGSRSAPIGRSGAVLRLVARPPRRLDRRDGLVVDRRRSQLGRVQQERRVRRVPRARARARGGRPCTGRPSDGGDALHRHRYDAGVGSRHEGRARTRERRARRAPQRAGRSLECARAPRRHRDRARPLARHGARASTGCSRGRRPARVRRDARAHAHALARRSRGRRRCARALAVLLDGARTERPAARCLRWAGARDRGLGVHALGSVGGSRVHVGSRGRRCGVLRSRARRRGRRRRARRGRPSTFAHRRSATSARPRARDRRGHPRSRRGSGCIGRRRRCGLIGP